MSQYAPEEPDTIQIQPEGGPAGAPPDQGGSGGLEDEPISYLQAAIEAVSSYQQAEPDALDKSEAAKILAMIHKLLAKDQQDRDSAVSGQLNPRALRKAGAIQ